MYILLNLYTVGKRLGKAKQFFYIKDGGREGKRREY